MKAFITSFLCCLTLFAALNADPRDRSSYPYISGDTFRAFSDAIYDEETAKTFDPLKIKPNSIIFVKTDFISEFFQKHHKMLKSYILITHNSVIPVPGNYDKYLNDSKLLAWFGINATKTSHPKLHPIPIGLANRFNLKGGNIKLLEAYRKKSDQIKKTYLVYMGFQKHPQYKDRSILFDLFKNKKYCLSSHDTKFIEIYLNISRSKFTLCPPINSLDTHRIWEALYLGSIPIVKRSPINKIYEGLPVLVVDDWKILTEEFLEEKAIELEEKKDNLAKLEADYWFKMIRSCKPGVLPFAAP